MSSSVKCPTRTRLSAGKTSLEERLAAHVQRCGRIHSVYGHLGQKAVLTRAYRITRKNACQHDLAEIAEIEESGLDTYLGELGERIARGGYQPEAPRRAWIPKSHGKRELSIPGFTDKVVQRTIVMLIGPAMEQSFCDASHGCRSGRGVPSALRAAADLTNQGYHYVAKLDVHNCYGSLDLGLLRSGLREIIADTHLLELIFRLVRAGRDPAVKGIPQGHPLSPLLNNVYLNRFDREWIRRQLPGRVIRYADDLAVFCRSRAEANQALRAAKKMLYGLRLRPSRDKPAHVYDLDQEEMGFLGLLISKQENLEGHRRCFSRVSPQPWDKMWRMEQEERFGSVSGWYHYYLTVTGWL